MTEMERVLLFGLSGDPPTGDAGHRGLVAWAASKRFHPDMGGALDGVWVVPVFRHAYPEKAGLSPYRHRLAMCRLGFCDIPGVTVVEAERELAEARSGQRGSSESPEALGTADLVAFLRARHPDIQFGLLLGADTARDLAEGRWKDPERLEGVPRVVAPRPGIDFVGVSEGVPEVGAVSSSAARAASPGERRRMLVPAVADYIDQNGLYVPR